MSIKLHLVLAYLKKQKGRTLILIAGVALAVMLVLGFNIINESQNKNQLNTIYKLYGLYEAEFTNLENSLVNELVKDENISQINKSANLGEIISEEGISIKFNSSDENFIKNQGYSIKKGTLPKNQDEIVLESQALKKLGLTEELNQTIYFDVKKEYIDENGENQVFMKKQPFKLIGILDKPSQYYEDWYALKGFTTFDPNSENVIPNNLVKYDGLVNLKSCTSQISSILNTIIKKYNIGRFDFNPNNNLITALDDYNHAQNIKSKENIKSLVIITSIFLIYNLFNISLNEMINQIGMLRTVGASKKDVRLIIGFQSLIIMVIGVIVGIIGGIIFSYIGMKIFTFTGTSVDTSLSKVYVSKESILNGVSIGIVSILISSLIPIWISGRISPLQALRKTDRSNYNNKNKFHHKVIRNTFGISGEMAYKNVWRNKFRTIVSIVSISLGGLLFINSMASAKSDWIENTNINISSMQDSDFDISYGANIDRDTVGYTNSDIEKILNIDGVSDIKTKVESNVFLNSDADDLDRSFKQYNAIGEQYENIEVESLIKGYDDTQLKEFESFIDKGNIEGLEGKSDEIPNAIVFNYYYDILNDHKLKKVMKNIEIGDILSLKMPVKKEDSIIYEEHKVRVAALLSEEWMFKGDSTRGRYFEIVIPQDDLFNMSSKKIYNDIKISVEEGKEESVYSDLKNLLEDKPFSVMKSKVSYEKEDKDSTIANLKSDMIIVTLILLIAGLNIFCTIRTNLLIRTSEFATLRAIGMTIKQIKSMIVKESLIYGLLSSIIAAILGTYKHYSFIKRVNLDYSQGMRIENVATFKIPIIDILQFSILAIIIGVLAVYISKNKIEKLNIIEGLNVNE